MTSPESTPPPLPGRFKNIQEVRSTIPGNLVSLIGFVKDFQPAIATSGTDWKSSLELVDPSVQYEDQGSCIKVHFFAALDRQLENIGPSDLVVLRDAKVQNKHGFVSLLTHWNTQVHILKASELPRDLSIYAPGPKQKTLPWISKSPRMSACTLPIFAEMRYALWASVVTDKVTLPSNAEFQEKTMQATNIRDKFSLLKDVKPNGYYNLIGQVLKLFDTSHGWVEIQFSDYTANKHFYEHLQEDDSSKGKEDVSHEYGYGNRFSEDQKSEIWERPYGKFTIQVTLFDDNASYATETVKVNNWVYLKNVRIVEQDHGMLEGKLHGQRGNEGKALMVLLDHTKNSTDGRLEEALKRKRELRMKQARQSQTGAGGKRRLEEDGSEKLNSKQRRKEARAAGIKKGEEKDCKAKALDLNTNVRSSYPVQPATSLAEIMRAEKIFQAGDGEDVPSPFTVRKYRANVRVVGFSPRRIEDFARIRRVSEYDILSDYSGAEDSDGEDDDEDELLVAKNDRGATSIEWEWCFALQVEDAEAKGEGRRLWLLVDNQAAQGLLQLDDNAMDLRKSPNLVYQLKEKLFILWGDLYDTVAATLPPDIDGAPPSTLDILSLASSPVRRAGDQPDADDSDDERKPSTGPDVWTLANQVAAQALVDSGSGPKTIAKNKPFTCCIKQYGIKLREDDPMKANAGKGKRWQRMFALFGTHIV